MWAEIALDSYVRQIACTKSKRRLAKPKKRWVEHHTWPNCVQNTHYKAYVKAFIAPGERASQQIGNMYTGSIFMALLSTLIDARIQEIDITGRRIGFLSYGSGPSPKCSRGWSNQTIWTFRRCTPLRPFGTPHAN